MSQKRSLIALIIVTCLIAMGLAGSLLHIELLQVAFLLISVFLVVGILTIWQIQSQAKLAKVLYSKKEFDRLQKEQEQTWTMKNYLLYYFGCGIVYSIAGIGLLYVFSTSHAIMPLLFGIGFSLSGLSLIITGSVFRESDMHVDVVTKNKQNKRSRLLLMSIVPIGIIGMYVLPHISTMSGDPMMNTFGLLFAILGIAMLPQSLWKAIPRIAKRA